MDLIRHKHRIKQQTISQQEQGHRNEAQGGRRGYLHSLAARKKKKKTKREKKKERGKKEEEGVIGPNNCKEKKKKKRERLARWVWLTLILIPSFYVCDR